MKINQNGFSLVEVMVGAGLLSALALGFAAYTKQVSTEEAKSKVKRSLYEIELQALDHLKSREICNQVLGESFKNKSILTTEISGDYSPIKSKGYIGADGTLVQKDIFAINDIYNGGKILISGINYKLKNLHEVAVQSSPWNVTGELEIKINFITCKDGKVVARPNGLDGVTRVCPFPQQKKSSKVFTKFVSFQRQTNGKIKAITTSGQSRLMASCADSQDAVVEASQDYTDLKACISEIKMHALMARPVTTKCNITLQVRDAVTPFYVTGPVILENNIAPNTMKAIAIGAGGGGGRGYGRRDAVGPGQKREAGEAGAPGQYVEQQVPDNISNCSVNIGWPGGSGQAGNPTILQCSGFKMTAVGGQGGRNDFHRGWDHGGVGVPALNLYGQPVSNSRGGSYQLKVAGYLGGSGGGGDAILKRGKKVYAPGTPGGTGAVILTYKVLKVLDPEGKLSLVDEPSLNLLLASTTPPAQQPPPLQAPAPGNSSEENNEICNTDLTKEINEEGFPYSDEEILEIRTANNCPATP